MKSLVQALFTGEPLAVFATTSRWNSSDRLIGRLGEEIARRLLQRAGYRFIEQNFRGRSGELDLLCVDQETLVAIEVKTRLEAASAKRLLFDSITGAQEQALVRTLGEYRRRRLPKGWKGKARIDHFGLILDRRSLRLVSAEHQEGVWLESLE